ncbi:MAG: hypothetical protein K2Q25_08170 [Mycobacteriaceae bacterium]|nr:hypothetical protein [Mycobacteriaceae bacterium]
MDHIIGGLQSERGWVKELFLEDLPAARVADTEFANAAMVKHRELVSELRSSTTPLVVGSEGSWAVGSRGINGVCVELETSLAGVRGSGNPLTAFSPATGSVSMPTAQLLSASTALSDYAMELEAIKCGPEFLAEVEKTHGLLAAEDFISALSRFVELHNLLLAELSAEVRLVAEDMGNAAGSYRDTDAVAAALIA